MMKSWKKAIIAALCAATLVVGSVAGTMAYLTDKTETKTNTFTVGNVGVALTETTSDYKMIPGNTIDKNPKVTVPASSEACWLFVKVDESANLGQYITYGVKTGKNDWTKLENAAGVSEPNAVYYREVPDSDEAQEFNVIGYTDIKTNTFVENKVLVNADVTTAQMNAANTDKPTLTFTAYAVQRANVDNVTDAWRYAQEAQNAATDNQGSESQGEGNQDGATQGEGTQE